MTQAQDRKIPWWMLTSGFVLGAAYVARNFYRFGSYQRFVPNTLLGLAETRYSFTGKVSPGFELVLDAFKKNFCEASDLASQFCVYWKGELVVDLAGNSAHSHESTYSAETLHVVFSVSKVIVAIVVAHLVGKGLLSYDHPVCRYWPEFARHGKSLITVQEVMRHESGLDHYSVPLPDDLYFSDGRGNAIANIVEDSPPEWSTKSKRCYNGFLYGFTLNELVKRVDPEGRTIGEILKEDICDKIGAEFYFGLPANLEDRVAPVVFPGILGILKDTFPLLIGLVPEFGKEVMQHVGPGKYSSKWQNSVEKKVTPLSQGPGDVNSVRFHRSHLPSNGGITNARSVAKILEWFRREGVPSFAVNQAIRLSTPRTLDVGIGIRTEISDGGFVRDLFPFTQLPGYYGWAGFGGSIAQVNFDEEIVVSYVVKGLCLSLTGGPRLESLWQATEKCIKLKKVEQSEGEASLFATRGLTH